jgi:peptide/nickel transport system substrate-binding protein
MAIDRDRIARVLGVPGWTPSPIIVAAGTPEVPSPTSPAWAMMTLADRRGAAAQIVARQPAPPPLRVAMPPGPGARSLFALIAADWRAIGIDSVAVGPRDAADLRLVDLVAPEDVASFYLRAFACDRQVPCTAPADEALVAARTAPTLAARAALLRQADALITQTTPFIALGPPIRWSLVSPALDLFRESPRGVHPLNELRAPLKR